MANDAFLEAKIVFIFVYILEFKSPYNGNDNHEGGHTFDIPS